jgi:type IX secretion system PorP/SprF family membrane protein
MKKLKTYALSALLGCSSLAFSQDIHFSQYTETPSLINPALIGLASSIRLSAIYKDQWRSITVPYKTYGAMFEMRIKIGDWQKVDQHLTEIYKKAFRKLAAGVSFFDDVAGDGNMGSTKVDGTITTRIPLGNGHSLGAGFQGGMVQRKIDFSKLIWPDQYNGAGYDPTLNSGETFGTSSFINGDFAGGLLWSYDKDERGIRANNQLKADAGVSFFDINKPRQKFLGADVRMYRKMVVHGKVLIGIKYTNVSLVPSFLLQFQGPQKELMAGMLVKYHLKEDSKYTGYIHGSNICFGLNYRNQDAIVPVVQLEFGQYALGMSYDVNISKLHQVSTYRGGFEISLRFVGVNPFIYQNSSRF